MLLIKPHYVIEDFPNYKEVHNKLEAAARTCYKSEDKIKSGSAEKLLSSLVKSGHHSVFEHIGASVRFIVDRGVSHELVRHRIASVCQESTRYCDYQGSIAFIIPPWCKIQPDLYKEPFIKLSENFLSDADHAWCVSMWSASVHYRKLRELGWRSEQARSVLPNSLKTEVFFTANMREWRHIFKLRCSAKAHPQMREVMIPLCREFQTIFPVYFSDIKLGNE